MAGWVTSEEYPHHMTEQEARTLASELEGMPEWVVCTVFEESCVIHKPWAIMLEHLPCAGYHFVREPTLEDVERIKRHICD